MNAKTEVERSAGEQTWIVQSTRRPRSEVQLQPAAPHVMRGTGARQDGADDRLSVDPLRETDRYRLVHPFTLPL